MQVSALKDANKELKVAYKEIDIDEIEVRLPIFGVFRLKTC